MATERIINEWIDAAGGFLRTAGWVDGSAGSGPVLTAMQAISNAELAFSEQSVPRVPTALPVAGVTYWLCTDTATLVFSTSAGSNVQIVIPAPSASIFTTGGLVVDPTNALIVAATAAAIGVLSDAAGNTVTAFVSGVKSSRRVEQNAPPG